MEVVCYLNLVYANLYCNLYCEIFSASCLLCFTKYDVIMLVLCEVASLWCWLFSHALSSASRMPKALSVNINGSLGQHFGYKYKSAPDAIYRRSKLKIREEQNLKGYDKWHARQRVVRNILCQQARQLCEGILIVRAVLESQEIKATSK